MAGLYPVLEVEMSHILHVEDSQDWLSTVRELLENAGHIVTSVASISEAEQHLKKVDIVICDGNLVTDFDGLGFDFAKKLHDQGRKVLVFASKKRDVAIPFVSKYDYNLLVDAVARL